MSGENAEVSLGAIDLTGRGLIADISDTLSSLSADKRAERRRQKLRDELVRDYIDRKNPPPSFLQALATRLR